jgi:DNA-binding GntR family transcriptional regulator
MTGSELPLERVSTVEALAASLRARILDGDLPGGARLPEQELCETYRVARHSVRVALRALAAEGLIVIAPNRGASVRELGAEDVSALYELRAALEVEAARLALARNGGRLPAPVHDAVARLAAVCRGRGRSWSAVVEAHDAVHRELVAAAHSPRILAAHDSLAGEMRLFVVQLRPRWTLRRMADDHVQLLQALEREGADALHEHLRESAQAVIAAAGRR